MIAVRIGLTVLASAVGALVVLGIACVATVASSMVSGWNLNIPGLISVVAGRSPDSAMAHAQPGAPAWFVVVTLALFWVDRAWARRRKRCLDCTPSA